MYLRLLTLVDADVLALTDALVEASVLAYGHSLKLMYCVLKR